MQKPLFALLLVSAVLGGCDAFEAPRALRSFAHASTDPAVLRSGPAWVAVAAVSEGKAYAFPPERFSVSFDPNGVVSGRLSGNSYAGRYTASEDGALDAKVTHTTLVSMSRQDERLAGVLLGEIARATRFEVEGRTLQVLSDDGDGVRFERNLPYRSQ